MIKIIAVPCSFSSPANCPEQIVTTSDFADNSMQSCLMGVPLLCHPVCRSRSAMPQGAQLDAAAPRGA